MPARDGRGVQDAVAALTELTRRKPGADLKDVSGVRDEHRHAQPDTQRLSDARSSPSKSGSAPHQASARPQAASSRAFFSASVSIIAAKRRLKNHFDRELVFVGRNDFSHREGGTDLTRRSRARLSAKARRPNTACWHRPGRRWANERVQVLDQGASDHGALLFPGRQALRMATAQMRQAEFPQNALNTNVILPVSGRQKAGRSRRLGSLRMCPARQDALELHIKRVHPKLMIGLLRHEPRMSRQMTVRHLSVAQTQRPLCGVQSGRNPRQRGLAQPVWKI